MLSDQGISTPGRSNNALSARSSAVGSSKTRISGSIERDEGTKELSLGMDSITGYTIINAADMDEAEQIAQTCPYISGIRVYDADSM